MHVFCETVKRKKGLLELTLLFFKQIITYCLAKMKTDKVILSYDAEV